MLAQKRLYLCEVADEYGGHGRVLTVRPYMKDYLDYYEQGLLMYANGDYFERQIEAALWRFDRR